MFTGIIESCGELFSVSDGMSGKSFTIGASFGDELALGESVCVDGVCLTVTSKGRGSFDCFVSKETLSLTHFSEKKSGDKVNLERSLRVGDRLSGHFVYGHVDTTGRLSRIQKNAESRLLEFEFDKVYGKYLINKGSVAVNGISLTIFSKQETIFSVMIIPHTWNETNLKTVPVGGKVNLEFDFIGKYLENFSTGSKSDI